MKNIERTEEFFSYAPDSAEVSYLLKKDPQLKTAVDGIGTLEYRPYKDEFIFLVYTIIGQMLSNKVADIICGRMNTLCAGQVTPENILHHSYEEIRSIGISNKKTEFIRDLAHYAQNHPNFFSSLSGKSDDDVIRELTSLNGIGFWSAKMYLIFVLNRPDVLPYEDGAFIQAYKWLYQTDNAKPRDIKEKCACWSPYSSVAARYLYRALDAGMTKAVRKD